MARSRYLRECQVSNGLQQLEHEGCQQMHLKPWVSFQKRMCPNMAKNGRNCRRGQWLFAGIFIHKVLRANAHIAWKVQLCYSLWAFAWKNWSVVKRLRLSHQCDGICIVNLCWSWSSRLIPPTRAEPSAWGFTINIEFPSCSKTMPSSCL